jgi:ferredoxin-type protein NapG
MKSKANKSTRRQQNERRRFIRSVGLASGVIGFSMLGLIPTLQSRTNPRLRPPGALDENDLLASCIKCGQCVQVCPVEAVKLADIDDGFGNGVPYIDARMQACDFSCDAVQCVLACPTGSLSQQIEKKEQVLMGLARLDKPEICLARLGQGFKGQVRKNENFQGLLRYMDVDRWNPIPVSEYPYDLELCDLCVRECPIEGAISLEPINNDKNDKRRTPIIHKTCVGCGVCEMMCPVEPTAIVIDERKLWDDKQA